MRGKAQHLCDCLCQFRITPAYAGKSCETDPATLQQEDHPRLCGEKHGKILSRNLIWGSPPPMRGKVAFTSASSSSPRITPAYAGKSLNFLFQSQRKVGSPPPMRGKASDFIVKSPETGITPAYAGKSRQKLLRAAVPRDHPRLCGEKTKKIPKQRYFFHQPASFSFSLQYT